MGSEANCILRQGQRSAAGRAMLETAELLFRSADLRVKIPLSAIRSARAAKGQLVIQTAEGRTSFELGPLAEKWLEKILHPKSRVEKLGVKAGQGVCLLGEFPADFLAELEAASGRAPFGRPSARCAWIFFRADSQKQLGKVSAVAGKMSGAMALWIVYPKGKTEITENHVLAAGRRAGLKDVKVVGFSPVLSALKFVIPVARR